MSHSTGHRKRIAVLVACAATMFSACGGGSGGSGSTAPPPPPPPPPDPTAALQITDANAIDVIAFGASISEGVMELGLLAINQVVLLVRAGSTSTSDSCDAGGTISAVVADADVSGSVTAGDTIDVSLSSNCFQRVLGDAANGTFQIAVTEAYAGVVGDAFFQGSIQLTDAFEIETNDSNGPLTITVEGQVDFSVAIQGSVIEGLRLLLPANEDLMFTIGANRASPVIERLTELEFSRRILETPASNAAYSVDYSLRQESEALVGSFTCSTTEPLTAGSFGVPPLAGRLDCVGAAGSTAALISDRTTPSDPLLAEADPEGDGTFNTLVTTADLFWSDFIEGPLYGEFVARVPAVTVDPTFGTVSISGMDTAINDLIYSPTNDKLYLSNPTGILEINPSTLAIERTATVTGVPTVLGLSDDGSTLWYGLEAENRVGRLTTQDMQVGADFQLGGSRVAGEIAIAGGSTELVAVSMLFSSELVAYNNGIELPGRVSARAPSRIAVRDGLTLVGSDDASSGHDVFEMTIDPTTGITVVNVHRLLSLGFDAPIELGNEDVFNGQAISSTNEQQPEKVS